MATETTAPPIAMGTRDLKVLHVPKDIVEKEKRTFKNPVVENQIYAKIGKSSTFEARPAIVHFGGYEIHQTHQQIIRIVNMTNTSRRINIIPTTTRYFKTLFEKKGMVAPGMSEDLYVEFNPTEWRYYYDFIRIQTEDENLLIPIHGYPVMNEVFLPKHVDFGVCPLAETTSRTISLSCKVPIHFEFSLEVTEANPDFELSPLDGVVPANGYVDITIDFRPRKMATSRFCFKLHVSQFGFEPYQVEVVGSSRPGLTRDNLIRTFSMRDAEESKTSFKSAGSRNLKIEEVPFENYDQHPRVLVSGGGSGGGDSPSREAKRNRINSPLHTTRRKNEAQSPKKPIVEEPPPETTHEGIRFPNQLLTHGAVAYVLTQEPGKLKIKDLRAAVEKKTERENKKREALSRASEGKTLDEAEEGDDSGMGARQLKELMFEREFNEASQFEESKNIKSFECTGSPLMTEEEIQAVLTARKEAERIEKFQEREQARGQYHVVSSRDRVPHVAQSQPEYVPSFDPYKNDAWGMRKQILDRLFKAVTRCITRNRIAKRLAKVQAALESGDPSVFHQEVDPDKDTVLPFRMQEETVHTFLFPFCAESSKERQPIRVSNLDRFEERDIVKLKVPQEYQIIGYKDLPLSVIGSCPPPETSRVMRTGAEEEDSFRNPRGSTTFEEIGNAPEETNPAPLTEGEKPTEQNQFVFTRALPWSEINIDFDLRPFVRYEPQFHGDETGYGSVKALQTVEGLADVWMCRMDRQETLIVSDELPELLDGPVEEDLMHEYDSEDEDAPVDVRPEPPTAETVRSSYTMPEVDDGPIARLQMEAQLDERLKRVRTDLTSRMQNELKSVNDTIPVYQMKLSER